MTSHTPQSPHELESIRVAEASRPSESTRPSFMRDVVDPISESPLVVPAPLRIEHELCGVQLMLLWLLTTLNIALTIGYVAVVPSLGLLVGAGATVSLGLLWWLCLNSVGRWMRNARQLAEWEHRRRGRQ